MLGFVDNSNRWKEDVLKPAVTNMLDGMGAAVVQRARELVPVFTGQLRDSISHTVRQSDMTVSIHADKSYAYIIEFGGRRRKARPFLRPALLAARSWSNRGANAELHFGGAGRGTIVAGGDPTGGARPKGVRNRIGAVFGKSAKIVRHPRHTPSILPGRWSGK